MKSTFELAALDALLDGGDDVIVLVDPRLRIVRASADAAALAARPAASLAGLSLIAAFGSAAIDSLARQALTAGGPVSGEAAAGYPAQRTFSVQAIPLADGDGLAIALHDVTSLRRLERVRRDFVTNVGHELRTPLTSIKLLAETLASVAAEDAAGAVEFARQIEREVDHLAQLTNELLELSMIESGETELALEPLEPDAVLAALAERIGPVAARREVRVRTLAPEAEPSVRALADGRRLGQALLNLAHNAVKYSHHGGEVRLAWRVVHPFVRFSVADDGVGISQTHQARIFERFYKVDRSRSREQEADELGGSAGLGLAIVRHIAEAHGGAVGVESAEAEGSTFWIDVPLASG